MITPTALASADHLAKRSAEAQPLPEPAAATEGEPLEGKKPAVDLPADEQSREADEEAEEAEEAGEEGQEDASKPLQGNRVYQYEIPVGDFAHAPPPAVILPTVHPRKNSLGFESNSSTALVKPPPPSDQAALVNAPCEDQALDDIEEVCDPVSDLQEFLQNYYEADPAAGYLSGAGLEGVDNPSPFGGDLLDGGGGEKDREDGKAHGLGVQPSIVKKTSNPLSGALSAALASHYHGGGASVQPLPTPIPEAPQPLERRHSFACHQPQIYLGSVVGFGYPGGPKINRSLSTSSGQALTHHQQVSGGSAGSGGRSSGGARGPRGSSSRYRGVTQHRRTKRWEAHVWDQGKQVYLGGFESEERAGRAYDLVVLKCRGAGARTNFAGEDYAALLPYLTSVTRDELVHLLRRRSKGFSKGSSKYTGVTKHK